jgi:signal transduction histidine kinase
MSDTGGLVYVVDDDVSVREGVASLIRSAGLEAKALASGQEFLALQRPEVPSCLVLDIQLPGLSGLDVQQELARSGANLPIIFLTGYGDIPMTVRAIQAGAADFLTKPFGKEELLSAIRRCFGRCHKFNGQPRDQFNDKLTQERLYGEDETRSEMKLGEIVGNSVSLRGLLKQVETVAPMLDASPIAALPFVGNSSIEEQSAGKWCIGGMEIEGRKQQEERFLQEKVLLEERNRIARELHDTLLQTFLGALCHLGVAVESLPPESQVKSKLDPILHVLELGIEEGRNAIQGLRSSDSRRWDLVVALSAVHQEFSTEHGVDFHVNVVGQQQPLRPAIQDEIYRIGREALVNAFLHSGAKRVELELEYADADLCMSVRDDGCGIDPRVLHAGREGHWGLAGMRERATRIGAQLEVCSSAAHGTEVQLSVPYAVAL